MKPRAWEVGWARRECSGLFTYAISYSTVCLGHANQICTVFSNPFPLLFVTVTMSPPSTTCRLNFFARLKTRSLLPRSYFVKNGVHLIVPLVALMAFRSFLLMDAFGVPNTSLVSPRGAVSL